VSQTFDQYGFEQGPNGAPGVAQNGNAADVFFGGEAQANGSFETGGFDAAGSYDAGGYQDGGYPNGASDPGMAPPAANGGAALQVAVVDSDRGVAGYLAELLDNAVVQAATLSELEHGMPSSPLVVVLGPSCATDSELAVVDRWNRTYANVASILVTADLSTAILQNALRAGVKDVLSAPIDRDQLQDAVVRVAQTLPPEEPMPVPMMPAPGMAAPATPTLEDSGQGRLISVFSTKGGSGKSVTATNLAVAMARRSPQPVILLDGHLQFGDVAVMLKLHPQNTVADAVTQLDVMDGALLERMLTVHEPSGLLVLPAPLEPTFVDRVSAEELKRLIDFLRAFAGTVVVDLPSVFNEFVLSVIESSDEIILVAGLDLPNIKNVKIGMSTLQMLNVPKERLHLVLNRADSKVKLNVSEVERTLGVAAASHVPSDVVVPISVNKGSPVVLSAAKSGVARAFEELAARFVASTQAQAGGGSAGRRKLFG
jgi:pilus assembly protein CpaE